MHLNTTKTKYIIFLFIVLSCNTRNVKEIPVNLITIDFMDFFNNDKISLKINDNEVFKNEKMKSNIVGYAQNRVYIRAYQNRKLLAKFGNKELKLQNNNKNIKLETIINGKKQYFIVIPDNGKFIGFDKDGDSLFISQAKKTFEYM